MKLFKSRPVAGMLLFLPLYHKSLRGGGGGQNIGAHFVSFRVKHHHQCIGKTVLLV